MDSPINDKGSRMNVGDLVLIKSNATFPNLKFGIIIGEVKHAGGTAYVRILSDKPRMIPMHWLERISE